MRSLWGIPGVQPGVFLAPGGYLLAVLISYAKQNSNAHHPKMFVAQKNKSYAKRQIRNLERRPESQPLGGISLGLARHNLDLGHLFARKAIRPEAKKSSFCSKRQCLNGLAV